MSSAKQTVPRRHLTSTTSTNAEALEWARDAAPDGAWVTSEEQVAGRGRMGRHWQSPRGNLYASVVLRDPGPSECWAQYGFVCGLALHDALCTLAPELSDHFKLKWPNDVLADGHKLSGILLESHLMPAAATGTPAPVIIAGFGVNVMTHPTDTPYRTTSLLELGIDHGPDGVWEELSTALIQRRARYRLDGFEPIRVDWMACAQGIGRPVCVASPRGADIAGAFAGIDAQGALQVETEGGHIATVHSGDVLFGIQDRSVA